jgi:hypothetical protein
MCLCFRRKEGGGGATYLKVYVYLDGHGVDTGGAVHLGRGLDDPLESRLSLRGLHEEHVLEDVEAGPKAIVAALHLLVLLVRLAIVRTRLYIGRPLSALLVLALGRSRRSISRTRRGSLMLTLRGAGLLLGLPITIGNRL